MSAALEMPVSRGDFVESEFVVDDGLQSMRRDGGIHALEVTA
jgi:hypothetical protein